MPANKTTPRTALAFLRARFSAEGDATSAASQKAYMKSALGFHGVPTATIRAATKELSSQLGKPTHDEIVAIVDALFAAEWFDVRIAALVLLERHKKLLDAKDLPWLIDLVRRGAAWAFVDTIATNIIGPIVAKDAKALRELPKWAKDADFWVRRTALLAQERELSRERGDFELFARIAIPMLHEKEFFIRKAIGWVLRSTSKKRPELVFDFLQAHRAQASGLTLREGAKYLSTKQRTDLGLAAAKLPAAKQASKRK
jgi:3-methyladenine DNA glycosylase AlkD